MNNITGYDENEKELDGSTVSDRCLKKRIHLHKGVSATIPLS